MELILNNQKKWASDKGLHYDKDAYLDCFQSNLFIPLDGDDLENFKKGRGNELEDKNGEKAKMKSLISSSALCVNFFLYLKQNGLLPFFLKTIDIHSACDVIGEFEKQLNTGVSRWKANLDFYIECNDCVIGIESKFTEHYKKDHGPLKQSYLDKEKDWQLKEKYYKSFPHLAHWINKEWKKGEYYDKKNKKTYTGRFSPLKYLDAAQLIKHLFALNNEVKKPYTLLYIHYDIPYDTPCEEIKKHDENIKEFSSILGQDKVHFISVSYQSIFNKLKEDLSNHSDYLDYMESRYFSNQI